MIAKRTSPVAACWVWAPRPWPACPPRPYSCALAQADERLSEDDAQAKALNYRHDATKVDHPDYQDGQTCANCQLYTDADAQTWGTCSAFPGRKVAAGGWCSAWVPRA
ncbi:MAG: high-potential iron-sulfur protein [Thioalkalivibrio sp.]